MSCASTTEPSLRKLAERAQGLYTLPAVAMEVLRLTETPRVDVAALKQCIENDPALTLRLLRTVNSSLFGLSREVNDLGQALALMGIKPLKLLVLGFSLPKQLFDGLTAESLQDYWRHSLTKAVAARRIAELLFNEPGDEAFVAGLLQNLGQLVMLQEIGAPYARFLARARGEGADLLEAERDTIGFDHTELSARLLEQWGLPKRLVGAVSAAPAANAAPPRDAQSRLCEIVRLAELLTCVVAWRQARRLHELLAGGQRASGLTLEQLQQLTFDVQEKVGPLAEVLAVRLPDEVDYADVLAEAHARLAEAAAEAAGEALARHQSPEDALWEETQELAGAVNRLACDDKPAGHDAAKTPPTDSPVDAALVQFKAHLRSGARRQTAPADPLPTYHVATTGRNDPGFHGRVARVMAVCRQRRVAVSVILVEMDRYAELVVTRGPAGAARLLELLQTAGAALTESPAACVQTSDSRFAMILTNCDRAEAVRIGRGLIERVRRWPQSQPDQSGTPVTISVGVASLTVPPKNFPATELIEAAERCLSGAIASAGDVVKSIAIC